MGKANGEQLQLHQTPKKVKLDNIIAWPMVISHHDFYCPTQLNSCFGKQLQSILQVTSYKTESQPIIIDKSSVIFVTKSNIFVQLK